MIAIIPSGGNLFGPVEKSIWSEELSGTIPKGNKQVIKLNLEKKNASFKITQS